MFVVVPITDVVIIKPKKFGSDIKEVLHKVGLCISLWDITKIGDMYILQDSGSYQVVGSALLLHANKFLVSFRFVCFRPSIDEVIIGTVKNCTPDGLHISLYFFDDIFIPADKLRHPSKFDFEQQCWIWQYEDDGESADLRIEKNDTIRFRVEQEIWQDPNPSGESRDQSQPTSPFGEKSPYVILGSIVSDGLGLTCWWIN
ncbi:unnamed protein product [Hydatigera taeniaeformis]|uniref:RNA_pol_Rbc25 domain-containing protein n=1 Tax=Hydatigena taeniaeformis TaxID=6205 RepID=A0A0R3X0D0_HYDTA|nr:unnamed protein product [Hydatigera taeniaeformis]